MVSISVIVPIYNAEKYLKRCIDSILSQSFEDYELLLIDDGSTDDSIEICHEYAKHDRRIILFYNHHQGISATRQFGLDHSTGKYILFVDSDDWIEPNMLEDMFCSAQNKDADIVACDFDILYPNGTSWRYNFNYKSTEEHTKEIISGNWAVVWRHLIRRELFIENSIKFPNNIDNGEDYVVMSKIALVTKVFAYVPQCLYHYNCQNTNSAISTPNIHKIVQQDKATEAVCLFLDINRRKKEFGSELKVRTQYVRSMLYENLSVPFVFKNYRSFNFFIKYWYVFVSKLFHNIFR